MAFALAASCFLMGWGLQRFVSTDAGPRRMTEGEGDDLSSLRARGLVHRERVVRGVRHPAAGPQVVRRDDGHAVRPELHELVGAIRAGAALGAGALLVVILAVFVALVLILVFVFILVFGAAPAFLPLALLVTVFLSTAGTHNDVEKV